jgi:hypothetical protein
MSATAVPMIVRRPARDWTMPAGLLVAILLLVVGGNLAGNGVYPQTLAGSASLPGWEQGSLFRVVAVWVASWPVPGLDSATALLLIYVLLASVGAVLTYRFLRVSDWPAWQALAALALIASHGVMLYSVTTTSAEFLLVVAAGALIPAVRRLEAVGDVQSIINYGLTLTLLLLAGPILAALIPLLVLAVPLREAEARQKPQVFAAMLLVAAVPAVIIIAGVWAMAARASIGVDTLAAPFRDVFTPSRGPLLPGLILLAVTAPVAATLLLHLVVPDRRRKIFTSLLAVALPLYVAVGNSLFDWGLAVWAPAAATMATVIGWLGTTRIRPWMRWLVLALLLLSSLGSWMLARSWADAAWLSGLLPMRLFSFHI